LTISEVNKSFLYFVPIFFGGSRDLKHSSERIKKHKASATHTENYVKFYVFGSADILPQLNEGHRVSLQGHNELVDKNIHTCVMGRITMEHTNYSSEDMRIKHISTVEYSWL
jgi:hypothetical protein